MADDLALDMDLLNLKKKKKKKKTPFDFDGSGGGDAPQVDGEEEKEKEDKHVTFNVEDKENKDLGDLDLESFGKKKKKSKKKISLQDLEGEDKEEEAPVEPMEEPVQETMEAEVDLDLDFSKMKKKAKKTKKDVKALLDEADGGVEGGVGEAAPAAEEREYTYDELLDRFYRILKERNPEMVTGEKKKFTMKPPQIVRVGTKKTSFVNFADICKTLHRSQKHVLDFLLAELGTQGSIDGTNQLIIKGRFSQKQIENVLRRYIKEYVSCKTCRSLDTTLQKDSRLHFLQCEACNSRCSVASIKAGFQAVTSKRAAQRAKEN